MNHKIQHSKTSQLSPIYRFNVIPIKIPARFFVAIDKPILKFIWKSKRTRLSKMILQKNNTFRGIIQLDFTIYCKATVFITCTG